MYRMLTLRRALYLALPFALALGSAPAAAQDGNTHAHQPMDLSEDCTFCRPWLYVEGAAVNRQDEALPSADADEWAPLVRALLEVDTPTRHLGLFAAAEFITSDDPLPRVKYGAQLWALPRFSDFNITGRIGLAHLPNGIGETAPGRYVTRGWGDVGVEYQTPLHEIALYSQVGAAFTGESGVEFQLGVRHPLAPWKFHGIP